MTVREWCDHCAAHIEDNNHKAGCPKDHRSLFNIGVAEQFDILSISLALANVEILKLKEENLELKRQLRDVDNICTIFYSDSVSAFLKIVQVRVNASNIAWS